jgi:predicted RNase H-like HicB family nuclease
MPDYIALLRKEAESDYSVDFPDFPGCVTAGRSLEEARKFASEALELHVHGMLEDGEELPAASALDAVMRDPHNRDAVVFMVSVPGPKAVRVNVTFPEDVLRQIDEQAKREQLSRSAFLAEAALERIRRTG